MDFSFVKLTTSVDPTNISIFFTLNIWVIIFFVGLLAVVWIVRYWCGDSKIKLTKITLKLGGQAVTFDVERNYLNLEIAHKIYIELITRKAALPIIETEDIIAEVYNSWYALFKTTREEIKGIRGELLDHPNSEALVTMATDVLNMGLRPHLTTYQGRFRRWYDEELENKENKELSPQEIQQKFPDYNALITSMKEVNLLLADYSLQLKKFIYE